MQASVPEVADISKEPEHVLEMYGPDVRRPGTFARHCLLARRLAERDVRYTMVVQLGWDHHNAIVRAHPASCRTVDQPAAALVKDLKQRGLLDDTLVIFGTEFGRTSFAQGALKGAYGRDHHGGNFSVWMAGGGIKPGITYGETDDFSYNIVKDPVHIHDFNATILRTLGIDHTKLTFRAQGRDFRLTDVEGKIVSGDSWRKRTSDLPGGLEPGSPGPQNRTSRLTFTINARVCRSGKRTAPVSRCSLKTTNSSLPGRYSHRNRTLTDTARVRGVVLHQRAGEHRRRHRIGGAGAHEVRGRGPDRQIDPVAQVGRLERQLRRRVDPALVDVERGPVAAVERAALQVDRARDLALAAEGHAHPAGAVVVAADRHDQTDDAERLRAGTRRCS